MAMGPDRRIQGYSYFRARQTTPPEINKGMNMTIQPDTDGTRRIIEGINADAKKQAEELLDEARKMADERLSFAKGKAEKIIRDAGAKAEEQAESTRRTILSGINVAMKREQLQAQDTLLTTLLAQATGKTASLIGTPEYRDILIQWITEAAAGLGAAAATVNASAPERQLIDDALLAEAAQRAESALNHTVTLTLSGDPPLAGQGVVVTAADGRTAFNNQVATRLRRNEGAIRNRVYDALFSSGKETAGTPGETDTP